MHVTDDLLTDDRLHVILSGYRTGSSALATDICNLTSGLNWGEFFALDISINSDGELDQKAPWSDEAYDKFSLGDVIKIQADSLIYHPYIIDELEKRYDCKFHILYRSNIFDQALSWTKAVISKEQFKDIRRKPKPNNGDVETKGWFHTDYQRKLIFDWNDENTQNIFDEKIWWAVRNNLELCKHSSRGNMYVFEDHFMNTRLNQPHIFQGRMSVGSYLHARWMASRYKQKLTNNDIHLRCDVPESCIPEEYL